MRLHALWLPGRQAQQSWHAGCSMHRCVSFTLMPGLSDSEREQQIKHQTLCSSQALIP